MILRFDHKHGSRAPWIGIDPWVSHPGVKFYATTAVLKLESILDNPPDRTYPSNDWGWFWTYDEFDSDHAMALHYHDTSYYVRGSMTSFVYRWSNARNAGHTVAEMSLLMLIDPTLAEFEEYQ